VTPVALRILHGRLQVGLAVEGRRVVIDAHAQEPVGQVEIGCEGVFVRERRQHQRQCAALLDCVHVPIQHLIPVAACELGLVLIDADHVVGLRVAVMLQFDIERDDKRLLIRHCRSPSCESMPWNVHA